MVSDEGQGRMAWAEREARRIVARRGDLVIAETRHGFVCANAGVDSSNVAPGFLTLLPEDPDGSAESIRKDLERSLGVSRRRRGHRHVRPDLAARAGERGDRVRRAFPRCSTFGGRPITTGKTLEATIVALADEVAAASGLVMGKASRVPAAIVRGVETDAPASPASELVRPPEEDLFRESPLLSISARRTIRSFGPGAVPREVIEEAVRAACTAPAPHHTRPWAFTALDGAPAKRALLARDGAGVAGRPARETASRRT